MELIKLAFSVLNRLLARKEEVIFFYSIILIWTVGEIRKVLMPVATQSLTHICQLSSFFLFSLWIFHLLESCKSHFTFHRKWESLIVGFFYTRSMLDGHCNKMIAYRRVWGLKQTSSLHRLEKLGYLCRWRYFGHYKEIFSYYPSVLSDSIKVGALLCEYGNTKFFVRS